MRHNETEIVLLKDKDWNVIDGEPCRVIDFSPLGAQIDVDGKVKSIDKVTPYASITMECEKLGKNIRGYITHEIDFKHLWAAFRERMVKEDEEVIIIWTRKNYKTGVKYVSAFMPKLWVMICAKGAFDLIINDEYKPELTGLARFDATKPIIDWKPEVMK
jgi:hypothetical protein